MEEVFPALAGDPPVHEYKLLSFSPRVYIKGRVTRLALEGKPHSLIEFCHMNAFFFLKASLIEKD